jgi:Lon protease-like protein
MSAFLPLFPLGLVVYPGEELHLHIFEPRYRQLIQECADTALTFGIPAVIEKKISPVGTRVRLREIKEVHEHGEMDIITEGLAVFHIVGPVKVAHPKLYSGTLVDYPENNATGDRQLMKEIILAIRQLHETLGIKKQFAKPDGELWSYDVAHHAGLSLSDEYRLLCLLDEPERQAFLREHLRKKLPIALEMEALKERVKLNGHFRLTTGFDWQ